MVSDEFGAASLFACSLQQAEAMTSMPAMGLIGTP